MPSIGQRKGVLLRLVSLKGRNSMRIYLPTHILAKRSTWKKISAYIGDDKSNDEWEKSTKVVPGRSGKHNCLPHVLVHNIRSARRHIPQEVFREAVGLSHVRILGLIAYVHIPDEKRKKLDPKSEKCILVEYSLEQKGYKCFNPSTQKVRVSRDVIFNKSESWYEPKSTPTMTPVDPNVADQEIEDVGQPWHVIEQIPIMTCSVGQKSLWATEAHLGGVRKWRKGRSKCWST